MSELEKATPLEANAAPPSLLFYGPPGSGKTTYFLHMPGKKFLIDADNKSREMANIPNETRKQCTVWSLDEIAGDAKEVQVVTAPNPKNPKEGTIPVNEPMGLRRIVNVINELLAIAVKCKRESTPFPFDVVGLDSFSAVSDHVVIKVKYDQKVAFISERNWGLVTENHLAVLRGFMQLPCTRVIIAHDKNQTIRDKETDVVLEEKIRPAIPGGLADSFGRHFTEVYYFLGRERSGDYKIQTVKDRLLMARTARNIPAEILIDQKTKQLILK